MGAGRSERLPDRVNDALDIAKHIVVPEPQHAIAFLGQELTASVIGCRVCMLATINFNDDATFETDKVCDIWADRMLPPESMAIDLTLTKMTPEMSLGVGHVAAELAGEIAFLAFAHPCAPWGGLVR